MKSISKISRMGIAFAMSAGLTLSSAFGAAPITAFAAPSATELNTALYEVSGEYTGGGIEVSPKSSAVTISQNDIKKDLYVTVHFFDTEGKQTSIKLTTGRGIDGTLKMSQVSVFDAGYWDEYRANTNVVNQADALNSIGESIVVTEDDFNVLPVNASAKSIIKNLVVAAFDAQGNLYGTFPFQIFCTYTPTKNDTVINGLDYDTIVSRVNDLQNKVVGFHQGNTDYSSVLDAVAEAVDSVNLKYSDINATKVSGAIIAIIGKISENNNTIDADLARIAELNADPTANADEISDLNLEISRLSSDNDELETMKDELAELQKAVDELARKDNSARDELKSLMEEYNTLYEELDYLRTISASNNAGYAGVVDGETCVFIDGQAFPYNQASGTEYTYVDHNGNNHAVVKYTADDGFDFFLTLDGVHVINSDGSVTLYEDTLEQSLFKVDNILKEISRDLIEKQEALNEFYKSLEDILGDKAVAGKTDAEKLSSIKAAVTELVGNYENVKGDYVALVQALNGELTEEEVLKLSQKDIKSSIDTLREQTKTVQDAIQKALTGAEVTDLNRQTLEELLANVSKMAASLETKDTQLRALVEALGAEDPDAALKQVAELVKKADKLETENNALVKTNKELKDKVGKTTNTSTSSNSSALKSLQDKVSQLTNNNSSLKSELSKATAAAQNAAQSAKNTSTNSSNTTSSTTTKALQDKIAQLSQQLSSGTTTRNATKLNNANADKEEELAEVEFNDDSDKKEEGFTPATIKAPETAPIDGGFNLNGADDTDDDEATKAAPAELVEEPESKINPIAVAIAAIIVLGLLGGGGFFAYKMFFAKPKSAVDLDALLDEDFDDEEGFDTSDDDDSAEVAMAEGIDIDDSYDDFDESYDDDAEVAMA